MPGKILGLDINRDSISAVQVLSGLKGYEIIACCRVMITEQGLEKALESLAGQMDLKSDSYLTVIPFEQASIRNLSLPFSDPRKIRQTLPFEIETMSPFPLDDLILDFNIPDRSKNSEILSVSVKKAFIAEHLSLLSQFGIDPHILEIQSVPTAIWLLSQQNIPDNGLFMDIGLTRNTMVLFQNRHAALIRTLPSNIELPALADPEEQSGDLLSDITPEQIESCLASFCGEIKKTLHSFEWQTDMRNPPEKIFYTGAGALYPGTESILSNCLNIPAEQINVSPDKRVSMGHSIAEVWKPALMDNALALAIHDTRKGRGFNLRKGEFETKRDNLGLRKELKKASIFIIIIAVFLIANLTIGYTLLKKEHDIADNNLKQLFKKEFPDITRIVNPLQQAEIKINEIKRASVSVPVVKADQRVLDLLKDISMRVSEKHAVLLTNMVIDMDSIRMSGETDSFNTVDSIKGDLEASDYFTDVTISSANLDRGGKQVQFELKLQRTR